MSVSIPSLLPTIQERLLDCISIALSKSPYLQAKQGVSAARTNMANVTQQVSDISGSVLVQLALRTLAHFNFKVIFYSYYFSDLYALSLKLKPCWSRVMSFWNLLENLLLFIWRMKTVTLEERLSYAAVD